MNSVLFITRQHLTSMLSRRETLVWIFVMPLVFFYFIGTVTGGGKRASSGPQLDALSLEGGADSGMLLEQLRARLEAQDYAVELRTSADPERLQARRRLILPPAPDGYASLSDAVLDGQVATLRFVRAGDGPSTQFDQVRVGRAVYGLLADMVLAEDAGRVDAESLAAVAAEERTLKLVVEQAGKRAHVPSGYEQTIPGTTVMFTMMILLTGGAIILVIEREQGLFRRLASTPISRAQLVTGKWIGMLGLAVVQIGFAMLVGVWVFRMDWGPNLGMVLLILLAWAAFNASLGILLSSFARSEAQMSAGAVLSTMILAALGGCWWPIEITPGWMQSLAHCLPTGWAMDAMHHLISFGDGAASALPQLALLSLSALVLGLFAVRNFRYQ